MQEPVTPGMAPVPGSQLLLLLHVLREARGALSASLAQAGAQGGGGAAYRHYHPGWRLRLRRQQQRRHEGVEGLRLFLQRTIGCPR